MLKIFWNIIRFSFRNSEPPKPDADKSFSNDKIEEIAAEILKDAAPKVVRVVKKRVKKVVAK